MRQARRYPVAPAHPHRSRRERKNTLPLPWVLTTGRCFDHGCRTQALSQWTATRWSASSEVPPRSAAESVDPLPSFRARQEIRRSGFPLVPGLRTPGTTNPEGQLFAGFVAGMADSGFLEPFVMACGTPLFLGCPAGRQNNSETSLSRFTALLPAVVRGPRSVPHCAINGGSVGVALNPMRGFGTRMTRFRMERGGGCTMWPVRGSRRKWLDGLSSCPHLHPATFHKLARCAQRKRMEPDIRHGIKVKGHEVPRRKP